MKKTSILVSLSLFLAMACGEKSFPPPADPVGRTFPSATGESLEGEPIVVPGDFAGEPVLLLLGYVQNAQFDADRWLFGLLDADLDLRFVEVPTIKGFVPGLIRNTIDSGMRGGIPEEDWGSVVTIYGSAADDIVRFTGNEKPQNVRAVLLDAEGVVRWLHADGYSAGKLLEMRRVLRQLDGSADNAPEPVADG